MPVEPQHLFPGNKVSHSGSDYSVLGDVQSSAGTLTILLDSDSKPLILQRDTLIAEAALVEEAAEDQQTAANDAAAVPGTGVPPQGTPQEPQPTAAQVPSAPPGQTSAANTPPGGNQ